NAGLLLSLMSVLALGASGVDGAIGLWLWGAAALLATLSMLIGRALFYALVVPTTMPGAFFWRNQRFQEHARETGLAEMEQVGVLPDTH
ncbi:MAG TPA: aspartate carbamoyltransferase, partial [Chromatiaceae bacterium]|nr:aspartate carbamoyltransferase [Chromatiaceae bacterium]